MSTIDLIAFVGATSLVMMIFVAKTNIEKSKVKVKVKVKAKK